MPQIVTSSSRRRPRRNSPHHVLTVVSAIVLCALAVIYIRFVRKAPSPDKSPVAAAPSAVQDAGGTHAPAGDDFAGGTSAPQGNDAPVEAATAGNTPAPSDETPAHKGGGGAAEEAKPRKAASADPEQERLQASYVYPTPGQAKIEGSGKILTFNVPPEGGHVTFIAEGKRYECYHDGTYKIIERRPVFEDPFEEQLIGLAMPGGAFAPGVLLNHTEEELKAMLARDVVINADDADDVVEKKEAVAAMKQIIRDYIDQGGDYIDFIEGMRKISDEERGLFTLGIGKIEDIIEDEKDIAKARRFLGEYNEILAERGFNELRLPKRLKAVLDAAEGE